MFKNKRSKEEILKYLMVFGGVPKYLEMIDLNRSFNQNMNKLCFSPQGPMVREVQTYKKIVSLLKTGIYSLEEISKLLKLSSGGGLKLYLENLERAEIIRSYIPLGKGIRSKLKKYSLADEYLHFYFKYIEPNLLMLSEGLSERLFETLTGDSFHQWLGFAFERFCFKHAGILAGRMGFKDQVLLVSPYFARSDRKFQIDLLYLRADHVITVCEIKHLKEPVGKGIIPEMERRCGLLEIPRGYSIEKVLVSLYGPDDALRESGYFNHYITMEDIFA
jgi:AAA+ ATPase superfamily predicted ATPase